jgi:hypothetical protein
MIKYTYNQALKKHQFIIHEVINGYYISLMYEENREEERDCMFMSNANEHTDEKICEEIVKKLRNMLIQYNEACTTMPKNIIEYVCEELICEFNINISF